MKKHLAPIIFLTLLSAAVLPPPPAFAAPEPWVMMNDVSDGPDSSGREYYLLRSNISKEKPVTYCIQSPQDINTDTLEGDIPKAFKDWMTNTITHINKSSRQKEFDNIIPKLRNAQFNKIDCSTRPGNDGARENVRFILLSEKAFTEEWKRRRGDELPSAWYLRGSKDMPPLIFLKEDYRPSLLHEIGHSFGMGDIYPKAIHKSDPRYGTTDQPGSIMDAGQQTLTCDDAEGIINIYDCHSLDKPFYRGEDKGWKSICSGRDITYKNCLVEGREDFYIPPYEDKPGRYTTYDKDGKLQNTYSISADEQTIDLKKLASVKIHPLENYAKARDKYGRITRAEFPLDKLRAAFAWKSGGVTGTFFSPSGPIRAFTVEYEETGSDNNRFVISLPSRGIYLGDSMTTVSYNKSPYNINTETFYYSMYSGHYKHKALIEYGKDASTYSVWILTSRRKTENNEFLYCREEKLLGGACYEGRTLTGGLIIFDRQVDPAYAHNIEKQNIVNSNPEMKIMPDVFGPDRMYVKHMLEGLEIYDKLALNLKYPIQLEVKRTQLIMDLKQNNKTAPKKTASAKH